MITADQLLAHGFGDYVLQSDWMARGKTRSSVIAMVHVVLYGVPFAMLDASLLAMVLIVVSHFFIDRYRLARYVVWLKNLASGESDTIPWSECKATGYPPTTPIWLATWLTIIVDNLLHVTINGLALRYL